LLSYKNHFHCEHINDTLIVGFEDRFNSYQSVLETRVCA